MSWGMCKCSKCNREVHQGRDRADLPYWYHCNDKTPICEKAYAAYANEDGSDINGKWCGADNTGRKA